MPPFLPDPRAGTAGARVTLFSSVRATSPAERLTIGEWCRRVTSLNGASFAALVAAVRSGRAAKESLPVVTPSAACRQRHRVDDVLTHTGLVVLDVDIEVHDAARVRDAVGDIPGIVFAALSASGAGVFALARVAPVPRTAAEHTQAWQAAVERLAGAGFEAHVEAGQGDVSRLRFASHDADAITAWDASPVLWRRNAPALTPRPSKPPVRPLSGGSSAMALRTAERMIGAIVSAREGTRHATMLAALNAIEGYLAGGALTPADYAAMHEAVKRAWAAAVGEGRERELFRAIRDAQTWGRSRPIAPTEPANDLADLDIPARKSDNAPISKRGDAGAARPPPRSPTVAHRAYASRISRRPEQEQRE